MITALEVPVSLFEHGFPFHFTFDRDLRLVTMGKAIGRLLAGKSPSAPDHFEIRRPAVRWDFDELRKRERSLVMLNLHGSDLVLKGSVNYLPDSGLLLFLGTPWLTSLEALEQQNLNISDFPPHDITPDCLFLLQLQNTSMSDLQRLSRALTDQTQELRSAEGRLRNVVEAARDLILTVSPDGRLESLSAFFEKLTGERCEDWVGRSIESLVTEADGATIRESIARAARREAPLPFEVQIRRRNGELVPVEFTTNPVLDGDRVSCVLAVGRDITFRREVDRLKNQLLSTVSHELRTPLTSMRGFVELLLNREYNRAKTLKYLGIVHTETIRLSELINNFLDLRKIEAGGFRCESRLIQLEEILQQQVTLFRGGAAGRHVHWLLPRSVPQVLADPNAVTRVLSNLLSNAAKFSPPEADIEVSLSVAEDVVTVSVSDQGIGMTEEQASRVFEPFYQASGTETRSVGGTGLGLTLARDMVRQMGGRIGVETSPGNGSRFWFTLPALQGSNAANSALLPLSADLGVTSLS